MTARPVYADNAVLGGCFDEELHYQPTMLYPQST